VQRLIAKLLMCWMLLLVPGATALDLVQPQVLLPACCRVHGVHHCMGTTREGSAPAWRAEGCPFANMAHAAVLPALYLPSTGAPIVRTPEVADTPSAELAALATFLAGLPGSRAPPSVA